MATHNTGGRDPSHSWRPVAGAVDPSGPGQCARNSRHGSRVSLGSLPWGRAGAWVASDNDGGRGDG